MTIMARYPAGHKGETRRKILQASEALMKEQGVEATSVDEVMRGAGLTVGGFYAHFASKEELASETLLYGLEQSFERMIRALDGLEGGAWVHAMIRAYLAQADDPGLERACPMTLLLADIARDDDARKRRFAETTRAMLDRVVMHFPSCDGLAPREVALATYGALVGAVSLARTTPSRTARHAIMRACETMLCGWMKLGDAPPARPRVSPASRRRPSS
jgi:TetR/AcrR family transcriptional repressor of nem operon